MSENEKILNLDPEDINVHTMMGDVFSKKNEAAKAFDEYLKAVEDFNNRGQNDKIASAYKKIAQLDQNQLGPAAQKKLNLIQLSLRADEALADNKPEEAIEALIEISKSDSDDMSVITKLAELEEKFNQIPAAVEHYSRLGEAFLKSRLLKKAQEIFKKVIALDPQNIPARSNIAQIYIKQGSENEAKKEYLNIAEQALANKNLDAALEYAKMAVELKSIEAHYFVGIVLFERRKWIEAKTAFDYLLRFKLNHVGAFVYLGKIYDAMDQPSKAIETFQKALKVEKDNLSALEAWADYCVKKKDKNEAIQTITLLINKAEAGNDPQRAVQWARTLVSVDGNLLPSKIKLAEALEKNNDSQGAADVYCNLALIHNQQNQMEDAARYIRKTLELNPTHAKALTMMPGEARPQPPSSVSMALESHEKNEVVSKTPVVEVSRAEDFKAQLDVADQYVKDGLLDEAIDIYQQLTEADPSHSGVKEKLNKVYAAYAKTGTDLTKAIINESELEEETNPNDSSPKKNSGKSGIDVEKHDEAALRNLQEMETKAQIEADKKVTEELKKRTDAEMEKKVREETEKVIRGDAERKIREEVEKRIREEEERKVREELEKKIRQEIEQKVRAEIEKEEQEETEKIIRENAEKKTREEEARKIREEEERKAREAAERKIRDELEMKAREEAQRKSLDEIQRKIRETIETKTREVAEKKAREAAENREKTETEQKVREEVERKVREEMERKKREETEKKIRESVERQVREEAEKNVRAEVERRTQEELEKQFRDDDKKMVREEAKKKIQEVMNKKTDELGEMVALGEADRLYDHGHYEEALRIYEKILESNPGHPQVLIKLSVVKEVLKSKVALDANHGGPPVLKLVESSTKPSPPPDPEKETEPKKTNNKIGYV